jgi:excisionase family DNA binding protein
MGRIRETKRHIEETLLPDEVLITTQQVADLLGVNPQTVTKAAKAGQMPCFYSGNKPLFSKKAIENFINYGSFNGQTDLDTVADKAAGRAVSQFIDALEAFKDIVNGPNDALSKIERARRKRAS